MIITEDVLLCERLRQQRYRDNQGYVYLIHTVGTDRYKIGRINPPVRLETLKKQSPYPLQIVECFWSPDAMPALGFANAVFAYSLHTSGGEQSK